MRQARWRVPVVVDGRSASIDGVVWRVRPPSLWRWLVLVLGLAAAAVAAGTRLGTVRLQQACVVLGIVSAGAALLADGFAASRYASPGIWLAGLDEAAFAAAAAAALAWAPPRFRSLAGGGLAVLGLAVGLSLGSVYLHSIVLSVLPGELVRATVGVALGAGPGGAVLAAFHWQRHHEPLLHSLPVPR